MTLGITGGIASGKSTVLRLMAEQGAETVDVDEISRRLTAPGAPAAIKILESFGPQFALQTDPEAIDRHALAKAIFHDPRLRAKLESITHPPIVQEMIRAIDFVKATHPGKLVAVEVPLLFEAGLEDLFDHVVVVWCTKLTQLERLRSRQPELDYTSLIDRIASQIPLDQKRSRGEFVIDTEKPLNEMAADVAALYGMLFDHRV